MVIKSGYSILSEKIGLFGISEIKKIIIGTDSDKGEIQNLEAFL